MHQKEETEEVQEVNSGGFDNDQSQEVEAPSSFTYMGRMMNIGSLRSKVSARLSLVMQKLAINEADQKEKKEEPLVSDQSESEDTEQDHHCGSDDGSQLGARSPAPFPGGLSDHSRSPSRSRSASRSRSEDRILALSALQDTKVDVSVISQSEEPITGDDEASPECIIACDGTDYDSSPVWSGILDEKIAAEYKRLSSQSEHEKDESEPGARSRLLSPDLVHSEDSVESKEEVTYSPIPRLSQPINVDITDSEEIQIDLIHDDSIESPEVVEMVPMDSHSVTKRASITRRWSSEEECVELGVTPPNTPVTPSADNDNNGSCDHSKPSRLPTPTTPPTRPRILSVKSPNADKVSPLTLIQKPSATTCPISKTIPNDESHEDDLECVIEFLDTNFSNLVGTNSFGICRQSINDHLATLSPEARHRFSSRLVSLVKVARESKAHVSEEAADALCTLLSEIKVPVIESESDDEQKTSQELDLLEGMEDIQLSDDDEKQLSPSVADFQTNEYSLKGKRGVAITIEATEHRESECAVRKIAEVYQAPPTPDVVRTTSIEDIPWDSESEVAELSASLNRAIDSPTIGSVRHSRAFIEIWSHVETEMQRVIRRLSDEQMQREETQRQTLNRMEELHRERNRRDWVMMMILIAVSISAHWPLVVAYTEMLFGE